MTFKNFIDSVTQKFHSGKTKSSLSREALVVFHWKVIVMSFLSATVLVFISGFLIYRDISRGEFFPIKEVTDDNSALVTVELLKDTVNYLKTKDATFKEMEKGTVMTVDPSR